MKKAENPGKPTGPFVRRNRAFFVGLFIIIPAVAIPFLLFYSMLKADFMQGWCYLHVVYENSYGLTKGNQVTISGMPIGHVSEIKLVREGIVGVLLKVRRQYQPLIRKDTRAQLKQKSFVVGDWSLELTGGTQNTQTVEEGDTLVSEYPIRLDKTISQITDMIGALEQSIQLVMSGKGTVGRLLNEDTLIIMAHQIARNVNNLTLKSKVTINKADGLLDNLNNVADEGSEFLDSLGLLMVKVNEALVSADSLLKDFQVISGQLPGTLGQVQTDIWEAEAIMRSLQNSWIFKRLSGKGPDPLLKESP